MTVNLFNLLPLRAWLPALALSAFLLGGDVGRGQSTSGWEPVPADPAPARSVSATPSVLITPAVDTAPTAWYDSHEGPQVSWQPVSADVRYRLLVHQRVAGDGHEGQGCEHLQVAADTGLEILFGHPIGTARVIAELVPRLRVRSDRSGLQLAVRVVLPRTADVRSGQPLTAVIRGTSYAAPGRWQQLRVDDLPGLLARHARALRLQFGPQVDVREAYVDLVLLNVYGGPGVTNVWIDDLDVAGYVPMEPRVGSVASRPATVPATPASTLPSPDAGTPASAVPGADAAARVRLDGSVLLAEDRPLFARILQYQGEPLDRVKQWGFNAVWLEQPPAPEMLGECRQLGLWMICPPPRTGSSPDGVPTLDAIGPIYDRVLAWDLGRGLREEHLPPVRAWAERVRAADRAGMRPLVMRPEADLRSYSRMADLLVLGRSPLGTSLELGDYGVWLRQRPRLTRPGTPCWATLQTQPGASLVRQWQAIAPGEPVPLRVSSEQLRLLVYTTITSGVRGLLFESFSPLSADDPDARSRAATLELLNLELRLMEPWLAAGNTAGVTPGNQPDVLCAVIETERARLLVPFWSAPGAQFVPGQSAANTVSITVPGVPESYEAYLMTAGSLQRLKCRRVAGGVRVTLDEFGLSAMVLLTQDPLVVTSLTQRAAQFGARAAALQRQIAGEKLEEVRGVYSLLAGRDPSLGAQARASFDAAQQAVQASAGMLKGRDYPQASLYAERAMRSLRILERGSWQSAVSQISSPVASPAAAGYRTLPLHYRMMAGLNIASAGSLLPGGDFEDPAALQPAGWIRSPHTVPGVTCEANLVPAAAHAGRFGLRLAASPTDPKNRDLLLETPPLWITSPAVAVPAGSRVRIHGWVQIPAPLTGSVDGLQIIDSIGGEPLSERIGETAGWQEFTLYRVAPNDTPLTLTLALTGLGEAWIDDLTVACTASPAVGVPASAGQ